MGRKRIGILTFWGVPNYGAFAQAYALNQIITKVKNGYEVSHIAYLHPEHVKLYKGYNCKFPKYRKWWYIFNPIYYLRILKFVFYRNKIKKIPYFDNDWNIIPNIKIRNGSQLEKAFYDVIITGSDCIWEFSIKEFGDDKHLIGNNLNCKTLIAYACSFGDMNPADTFPSFVETGLKNYDFISVRDSTSKAIVERYLGKEKSPQTVLDPTLLYNFLNDSNIPEAGFKDYIVVYGQKFKDKDIQDIKEYAKENGYKIIGAGLFPKWVDEGIKNLSPLKWISLFKEAKFVVTCTFHGLMFSINFRKVVFFHQVEYVKNRSTYLLDKLGLLSLFQKKNLSLSDVLNFNWDYDLIEKSLQTLRDESMQFIERSLHDE